MGVVFAIVCYLVISVAAKPFSTSQYCGSSCHEMNTAYSTWELSIHQANKNGVVAECVDCHLPAKDKFFAHMTAKAYAGAKDIYVHQFGGEYDPVKMRKYVLEHMPDDRCTGCHKELFAKPSTPKARKAHLEARASTEKPKPRCVDCHNKLHEREKKLFSPD